MEFERQAISAGIAAARPIDPVAPAYGWAGRVAGHGAYRVYEWVDNRPLTAPDDIAGWLGRTPWTESRVSPLILAGGVRCSSVFILALDRQ